MGNSIRTISFCCITDYPKLRSFRQKIIISQFLWVRNPGAAQLGTQAQGLSGGCIQVPMTLGCSHWRLIWDWRLHCQTHTAVSQRPQSTPCGPIRDSWLPPEQVVRARQRKTRSEAFCNLTLEMTIITSTIFCLSHRPTLPQCKQDDTGVWLSGGEGHCMPFQGLISTSVITVVPMGPCTSLSDFIHIVDIMEEFLSSIAYEQINRTLCLPRCTQWHLNSCIR